MIGRLVGIADGAAPARIAAAVDAGLPTLLLRSGSLDTLDLHALRRAGTEGILHARIPGAEAWAGAHGLGLHLPGGADTAAVRARFPGLLGQSTHSPDEAHRVLAAGADYVFLSPIFPPTSKPGDRRPPLGVDALRGLPSVVALGGLRPDRVRVCLEAGAVGVAVLGGIFGAPDVGAAVRAFLQYDQRDAS